MEQFWSEPVDSSKSIPITLIPDLNLPLIYRDNKLEYDLADRVRKGWNFYRTNATTETTLNLYQWLRFQLGCHILNKHKYLHRVPKNTWNMCSEAYKLLDSGRIIRWRLI